MRGNEVAGKDFKKNGAEAANASSAPTADAASDRVA